MSFTAKKSFSKFSRAIVVAAALAICAAGASPFFGATRTHATCLPWAPDKKSAGLAADKGKFKILVNGQPSGKEEFEISSSGAKWVAKGNSEIQTPQGATKITGSLTTRADGSPESYDWSTQGAKKASAAIAFNADIATAELHMDGARPYTQQFTFNSPNVVILDDNMYHQYQILANLYDMDKKGAQTFAVLVPQELTPGNVTVEWLGKQDVDNKKMEELRVKTEDNEIDLYLDGSRLMRLVAPAANAEVIRDNN
jgi:hypothetical protein